MSKAQSNSVWLVVAAMSVAGCEHAMVGNATALVLCVRGLAGWQLADTRLGAAQLPVPPRLKVGDALDGYTITAAVADTAAVKIGRAHV